MGLLVKWFFYVSDGRRTPILSYGNYDDEKELHREVEDDGTW